MEGYYCAVCHRQPRGQAEGVLGEKDSRGILGKGHSTGSSRMVGAIAWKQVTMESVVQLFVHSLPRSVLCLLYCLPWARTKNTAEHGVK